MMQRLVGVGDVEPRLQHSGHDMLGAGRMALVDKSLVFWLVPDIGAAVFLPRLWRHLLVSHHAKRRDDIFFEILVLIVAPNHNKVGVELIEHASCVAKAGEQPLTMAASS